MSRKTWVVPLVGQSICRRETRSALASPMVWPQRASAEAAAGCDVAVDRDRIGSSGHDLDARADRGAVALGARQLDRQPVISLAGVLKQHVVIFVAVDGTAGLDEDVDVAVRIPVAAGDAVAFLQVAGTRGAGDLGKAAASHVLEHPVRDEQRQVGVAGAEIEVEPTVVVKVGEVAAHGRKDHVQPGLGRAVFEAFSLIVSVQAVGKAGMLLAQQAADDVFQGEVVRSCEDVDPAVVVVVESPAWKTL